MPLINPLISETQSDFISRFMSNPISVKEYPDQKQRLAVGYSQWRRSHNEPKKKMDDSIINSHYWVVKEMVRRGISHESQDVLDQETDDLAKQLSEEAAPGLHQDVVDPDLANLREELVSLTIDRIIGLSDDQLKEFHYQAGLVLVERDKQRVQDLLEGEMRRRGMLETEKKEEEKTEKVKEPIVKALLLSEDQQKVIFKELDRIKELPIHKHRKQLSGLWKSYHLGLQTSEDAWDFVPPFTLEFDCTKLGKVQEEVKKSLATFEITKIVQEERMVYGPVLVPEVVDGQEDVVSATEIRKAAWRFMDEYATVGFMHTVQQTVEGIKGQIERAMSQGYTAEQLYKGVSSDSMVPGIAGVLAKPRSFTNKFKIRDNYITQSDFTLNNRIVRKGTWVMGIFVADDFLWEQVKSGKIQGFSIGGESERIPI